MLLEIYVKYIELSVSGKVPVSRRAPSSPESRIPGGLLRGKQRSLHSRWFAIRITNTRLRTARALDARLGLGLMPDISREIHHKPLGLRTRLRHHLVAPPLRSNGQLGEIIITNPLFFFNYTPYRLLPLRITRLFSGYRLGKGFDGKRIDSTKCYIVRFLK